MAKKTKKCKICGERKDISLFKTNKKTKDGVISICKECSNLKRNENKDNIKHDNFYLYKLLDKDNTVLYVGKTTNINKVNNTPLSASESIIVSVIILIFIMFILAVSN